MAFNNEIEKTKKEIEVLTAKLALLDEIENHKTPCEIAYKKVYGSYPITDDMSGGDMDYVSWSAFQRGYEQSQKDYKVGEYQEPAKDVVSLYKRFEKESAYGRLYYDDAIKVVREFLMDEAVIENEDHEYITFTLQKSLLEVTND